jgi:prepilin-type processing-associated H-X9-DG protein
MSFQEPAEKRGTSGAAAGWMFGLSILLAPLLILGPFIAGFVGGRKARIPVRAFAISAVCALMWIGVFFFLSRSEFKVGDTTIFPGPLWLLAPVTAAAIIGGALLGAEGRGAGAGGFLLLLAGLGWFIPKVQDVWNVYQQIQAARVPYEPARNKTCPDRLKKLYDAARFYADSYDDCLPPADRWMTALTDPTQPFAEEEILRCPDAANANLYGYAMNSALGGKRFREIANPSSTPLFYDSSNLQKDAHDSLTSLPRPGRHMGRNNVVYADGQVKNESPK